ncbi:YbhB/YbcL family Raf kinase inhibitor-like protein [Streptomyces sp. NPDC047813]|uniref:YbhB/YbcL family Raf kinase inhibitor-like protein n=1 Tax=Streptomyces sp. NPDC047813 TaxID=3154608 RepID=UPI003405F03B
MRRSLAIAAVCLAAVTGCGGGTGHATGAASPTDTTATRGTADTTATAPAARRITVTSTAYADGGTVPRRFTCDGADVSPPLALSSVPAGTDSLAVTVRDLDAPGGTFTHWLIWDLDAGTRRLSAGAHPHGAAEGRNSFGKSGYRGPCPPRGDHPHRYVLTVYATDRRPPLSPGASPDALRRALSGHTLATGTLTGRYGP